MPELHAENGLRVTFEYEPRSNETVLFFFFFFFLSLTFVESRKSHM